MANEYTCAMCGNTYSKGWTDEEANNEYMENFGPVIATHDEGVMVCDDCYNKIHPKFHSEKIEAIKTELLN